MEDAKNGIAVVDRIVPCPYSLKVPTGIVAHGTHGEGGFGRGIGCRLNHEILVIISGSDIVALTADTGAVTIRKSHLAVVIILRDPGTYNGVSLGVVVLLTDNIHLCVAVRYRTGSAVTHSSFHTGNQTSQITIGNICIHRILLVRDDSSFGKTLFYCAPLQFSDQHTGSVAVYGNSLLCSCRTGSLIWQRSIVVFAQIDYRSFDTYITNRTAIKACK